MANQSFIIVSAIAIFLTLSGLLVSFIFTRATKSKAYVRTGYGGEKIILNTGAFALPIVHKIVPVSLTTKIIEICQSGEKSLITKDRLRADITINFYLNVEGNEAAIALAAQTLGTRTVCESRLKELLEGKLIDSVRTAGADYTMAELQEQRQNFVSKIKLLAHGYLSSHGLIVESVSVTSLDQTDKKYFNSDNIFDAEGLTSITRKTQESKKTCNEIEQDALVEVRRKQLESERLVHEMERKKMDRKLSQKKDLEAMEAAHRMAKIQTDSDYTLEQEKAKILVAQEVSLKEQDKAITLAEKSKERSKIEAQANITLAETVNAEEQVVTAREVAKAERQKQVDLIVASMQAERETMSITSYAAAKKQAATDLAEATRIQAESQSQAETIIAGARKDAEKIGLEALRSFYDAHTKGIQSLIATFKNFSKEKLPLELRLEVLDHIPRISEKIDAAVAYELQFQPVAHDTATAVADKIDKTFLPVGDSLKSEVKTNDLDQITQVKSTKIRNIISEAHKSVLQEAISTLNEMSDNSNVLSEAGGNGQPESTHSLL